MESVETIQLIIRADADAKIGSGHLMRCLALAQGWKASGGEIVFITNCESANLLERLKKEGFNVVEIEDVYPHQSDWQMTEKILNEFPKSWCVVDGYHFDADYHRLIRNKNNKLLVVDDTAHLEFYDADVILNQNINADKLSYNCPPETRLLLGTRYAMLRREFLEWRNWKREVPEIAAKILITMGGSDFYNQTLKAIRAVEKLKIENLEVRAVVGSSNPHLAELKKTVENSSLHIELIHNAENMPELMSWADLAISAAGSTCWELTFMSIPTVLLILAENQIGIATGLDNADFAENLGWYEQISAENISEKLGKIITDKNVRRKMSNRGCKIMDGHGTERIIDILRSNA